LNYSTTKKSQPGGPEDWISQAEAARLRGVSQQAIANLISRGRLKSVSVAGRTFVYRSEVEAFEAKPKTGRPPKNPAKKALAGATKKSSKKKRSA
jgi:hypothetical protein